MQRQKWDPQLIQNHSQGFSLRDEFQNNIILLPEAFFFYSQEFLPFLDI